MARYCTCRICPSVHSCPHNIRVNNDTILAPSERRGCRACQAYQVMMSSVSGHGRGIPKTPVALLLSCIACSLSMACSPLLFQHIVLLLFHRMQPCCSSDACMPLHSTAFLSLFRRMQKLLKLCEYWECRPLHSFLHMGARSTLQVRTSADALREQQPYITEQQGNRPCCSCLDDASRDWLRTGCASDLLRERYAS